jgi:hypothetical protein
MKPLTTHRTSLLLGLSAIFCFTAANVAARAVAAEADAQIGQPAELSAWAYAYRADRDVQEKPEACFILRRLERLDRTYRPVNLLLSQPGDKDRHFAPAPTGVLQAALLWEQRVQLHRIELHWSKEVAQKLKPEDVEVRVYPSPFGWFGWQADQRVTVKPSFSADGMTWVYQGSDAGKPVPMESNSPPPGVGIGWGGTVGGPNDVDLIAVFVRPGEGVPKAAAGSPIRAVPQIRVFGPETWKKMDIEVEWGLKDGSQQADFDGRAEGFFGHVEKATPLPGDSGTTVDGPQAWKSHVGGGGRRRGVALSLLYIQPAEERVGSLPKFPHGHPRDSRITIWTKSGSFTFLVKDLEKGPILAPEYGFFMTKAGSGKTGRVFAAELAAAHVKSIREMIPRHREATWDEAMREIKLPLMPPGTTLPPAQTTDQPPMQVELPEARWVDAWRTGVSHLRKGELSYMDLALEAPRPVHDMDLVGLGDTSAQWLDHFLYRPGTPSDGDFSDGSGNFCAGKLFFGTASIDARHAGGLLCHPGCETYELVHNGGTGRILYDLAEHYFLTGDAKWFKTHQWRLQAAAEWIMRQRAQYMSQVPNRAELAGAGLHPPQHIADCAWGQSEWKWYTNIDAWYYQGLRRFAQALREFEPELAARYLDAAEQYRQSLQKAVDRAITLSPVMRVRNGNYRSYIPPLLYTRGPSIGQVCQIAMTDDDWPLEVVDSAQIPGVHDVRLDGHLDVCEDVMTQTTTYLCGGDRHKFLCERRKERGCDAAEDWFWGGQSPQLGYSFMANVYLRRDDIPAFLRQWVNNYAAFVVPTPEYCFFEHFMNHTDQGCIDAFKKGDYRRYMNGHALAYFMEQFRNLLVWEEDDVLWLAKATPRHWLEQGKKVAVRNAPSYFGPVGYDILSDADHGRITATVDMPSRKSPKVVRVRLRHPNGTPISSVMVNGSAWTDFSREKECVDLKGLTGKVVIVAQYESNR